jgi:hypothetical protein
MVLRKKILGHEKEGVTGDLRKLYNERLHSLYSFWNVICVIKLRTMRWLGHVAYMGEEGNACRVLVRKPKGKRPLRRTR